MKTNKSIQSESSGIRFEGKHTPTINRRTENRSNRFEFSESTLSLLNQMQLEIKKRAGRKISIQKLVMYYFTLGLRSKISFKSQMVQKHFTNDPYLMANLEECKHLVHSLDQDEIGFELSLKGIEQNASILTSREQLLQLDLIEQLDKMHKIRREQEENDRIIQLNQEKLRKKEVELSENSQKWQVELTGYRNIKSDLDKSKSDLRVKESILKLKEETIKELEKGNEKLQSEKDRLYNLLSESQQSFKDYSSQLKSIRHATDKLLEAENSITNKLLRWAPPIITYFVANQSIKSALSENKELRDAIEEIRKVTKADSK